MKKEGEKKFTDQKQCKGRWMNLSGKSVHYGIPCLFIVSVRVLWWLHWHQAPANLGAVLTYVHRTTYIKATVVYKITIERKEKNKTKRK